VEAVLVADRDTREGAWWQRKRPDWLLTLAMIVGGIVPTVLWIALASAEHWSIWFAVPVADVLFIVAALGGGILALIGEKRGYDC
jgi:hypothetical protein